MQNYSVTSVARVFDVDFIFFDIIFTLLWIIILKRKELNFEFRFGLMGATIIFVIDAVIWYLIRGTREVLGPVAPFLFLFYFSVTYGIVMFSFVSIMFKLQDNYSRLKWTVLLYGGWIIVGLLSQHLAIDDRTITTSREMSRSIQALITVVGFVGLTVLSRVTRFLEHLTMKKVTYLFLVGVIVHLGMEFSLLLTGIRPLNISILIFNSMVEFNNGIPVLYIVWYYLRQRQDSGSKVNNLSNIEDNTTKHTYKMD